MPFAKKFRAMMDFPFPGDTVGDFTVESVEVWDEQSSSEGHIYGVRMVLHGPGGKQGVKHALKDLFARHPVTFSAYGNPYQLWFRKPEVENLGGKRYEINVKGVGERIYVDEELRRFLAHLIEQGHIANALEPESQEALISDYLVEYQNTIQRQVGRYRRKVKKLEDKK